MVGAVGLAWRLSDMAFQAGISQWMGQWRSLALREFRWPYVPVEDRRPLPEHCLRDPLNPRSWSGMSVMDVALLENFLGRAAVKPARLWTDVPLLRPERPLPAGCDPCLAAVWERRWARRMDAVIHVDGLCFILEMGPGADFDKLGQCQFYWYHASREYVSMAACQVVMVTDVMEACCAEVFAACGVEVVELGPVAGVTPAVTHPRERAAAGVTSF